MKYLTTWFNTCFVSSNILEAIKFLLLAEKSLDIFSNTQSIIINIYLTKKNKEGKFIFTTVYYRGEIPAALVGLSGSAAPSFLGIEERHRCHLHLN